MLIKSSNAYDGVFALVQRIETQGIASYFVVFGFIQMGNYSRKWRNDNLRNSGRGEKRVRKTKNGNVTYNNIS